ncbi:MULTISPECIES: sensor histidine kinase [Streptosporangium]|uniref:histidine kinase n=1 Tax=Streptosporangium brasiliense TaxID=47480 RepID=A0ABT9QWK9_9ACTN|nr:histidine kinase [Streptosporangium brasiliense]MDP9861369.1 signal transduction histidine kinase [Streptosporangium brasiliense]
MTTTGLTTPWDRIHAHWSARTWLRTSHVVTGLPIALLALAVIVGLTALSVLLVWTVVVPLIALPLLFRSVPMFTRLQRARFLAFLDVDIPRAPRRPKERNPLKLLVREARTGSFWRQLAYHLLSPLINGVGFLMVIGAWAGGLVAAEFAVQGWIISESMMIAASALAAVLLLVTGPWVAHGVTALDTIAAGALLGPSRSDLLVQRVETLQESRAEVVDAADAERRRIERDLHDGAQQRLVSLAMSLGMARATLTDVPEPARRAIAQAHEEAKQALKELRDFVRGLHPAVLDDQGLDAALSGIAARAPFPVRLRVDVPERASPTIEAIAFFVVSEALTNVSKHAGASGAEVTVQRAADRLRLVIVDDGRGGARLGGGTGLRGLAQRVGSVDGTLDVDSPQGGPTAIRVELPCE